MKKIRRALEILRISSSHRYSLLNLELVEYGLLSARKVRVFVLQLIAMQLSYLRQRVRLKSDEEGLLELQPFANWTEWIRTSPIHRIGEVHETQAKTPSTIMVASGSFNPSVKNALHSASRILCPVLRNLRKIRVPQTLQVIAGCHLPSRSRVKL